MVWFSCVFYVLPSGQDTIKTGCATANVCISNICFAKDGLIANRTKR